MFYREFAIPQQGKSKSIFEIEGQKVGKLWASVGACIRLDWGLYQALWGLLEGFRSHSPLSHENSPLPAIWCNRFLGLLANFRFKAVFRGFIWVYRV